MKAKVVRIGGDDCELVTDFHSLNAGTIVWHLGCRWCGGNHRKFLLRVKTGNFDLPGGRSFLGLAWRPAAPDCQPELVYLTELAVANRRVYRVINPINGAVRRE